MRKNETKKSNKMLVFNVKIAYEMWNIRCLSSVHMTSIHSRIEYALALEIDQALMKMNTEIHMTNDRHAHFGFGYVFSFGFVVAFFFWVSLKQQN